MIARLTNRLMLEVDGYRQETLALDERDEAVACLELELYLSRGLWVYNELCHHDEVVRSHLHATGRVDEIPAFSQWIGDMLQHWKLKCEATIASIETFESRGYAVDRADEYREACRSVAAMLMCPDEFYGDRHVSLRDAAIDDLIVK